VSKTELTLYKDISLVFVVWLLARRYNEGDWQRWDVARGTAGGPAEVASCYHSNRFFYCLWPRLSTHAFPQGLHCSGM